MDASKRETARKLFDAWRNRQPLEGHRELAALPVAEAGHAIQDELQQLFRDAGRKPIGWKLGLTSRVALDMFGADEPMVGVIYADSLLQDGATLEADQTVSPRIEGEMLLEIGSSPQAGATEEELVASLASVSAALEIADSHIAGWPNAIGGAIADNACCGWLMRSANSIAPKDADFANTAMEITSDGGTISQGYASACLGSVLNVYRWFIEDSHSRGRKLRAGEIILTGAMGPAIPMERSADYTLDCAGLGQASLRFGMSA